MKRFYYFFYTLLLIILFFALFFRPITAINYDLGRHLLLAQITLQEQHVPYTNLLSFTYPNYPFMATSWLSEIIFYGVVKAGGFSALLLFSTGITLAACLVQLKFVLSRYSFGPILAVSTLYLIFLGTRSDIRPEFFSMLFVSLFIFILRSYKKLMLLTSLILIVIEVLWVNMHIYFVIGPLLIALSLLDKFIVHKEVSIKEILVLVAVSGATLLNPNGLRGALYPLVVFQNYGFPIIENQSIYSLFQLSGEGVLLPIICILILVALLIIGKKNTKPIDWLLSISFSILFISNYRNILLFVFATFIPAVSQLNFTIKRYSRKITSIPHPPFIVFYLLSIFLVIVVIAMSISQLGIGFGMRDYGKKSVGFIIQNKIDGRLYNNFDIGGYLIYRLYPRFVFLDNRPEAYPASFFEKTYLPMQDNPAIFRQLNSKYKFNALIVSHRDGVALKNNLFRYFMQNSGFSLVYLDSYAFVMVQNSTANREIVKKFKITQDSIRFSDEQDPRELIYYLSFFGKIGWNDKAKEAFSQLKKVDPTLCSLKAFPFLRQAEIDFISENDFRKCRII